MFLPYLNQTVERAHINSTTRETYDDVVVCTALTTLIFSRSTQPLATSSETTPYIHVLLHACRSTNETTLPPVVTMWDFQTVLNVHRATAWQFLRHARCTQRYKPVHHTHVTYRRAIWPYVPSPASSIIEHRGRYTSSTVAALDPDPDPES